MEDELDEGEGDGVGKGKGKTVDEDEEEGDDEDEDEDDDEGEGDRVGKGKGKSVDEDEDEGEDEGEDEDEDEDLNGNENVLFAENMADIEAILVVGCLVVEISVKNGSVVVKFLETEVGDDDRDEDAAKDNELELGIEGTLMLNGVFVEFRVPGRVEFKTTGEEEVITGIVEVEKLGTIELVEEGVELDGGVGIDNPMLVVEARLEDGATNSEERLKLEGPRV